MPSDDGQLCGASEETPAPLKLLTSHMLARDDRQRANASRQEETSVPRSRPRNGIASTRTPSCGTSKSARHQPPADNGRALPRGTYTGVCFAYKQRLPHRVAVDVAAELCAQQRARVAHDGARSKVVVLHRAGGVAGQPWIALVLRGALVPGEGDARPHPRTLSAGSAHAQRDRQAPQGSSTTPLERLVKSSGGSPPTG